MRHAACIVILLQLASTPDVNAQARGARGTTPASSPAPGFRATLTGPRVRPERPSVPAIPRARFNQPLPFVHVWWPWGALMLPTTPALAPLPAAGAPTGGVQLDVLPWSAQVFVDGALAGRVEEFRGYYHHLELSAGPHALSIVKAGYEPLVFDVVVVPGRTVTYRATLR